MPPPLLTSSVTWKLSEMSAESFSPRMEDEEVLRQSGAAFSSVLKTSGFSEGDTMSWGEFIELRELRTSREQIELTPPQFPCSPPRLERTNALRISPGKVPDLLSRVGIIRVLSSTQDPQLPEEKGEGHNFQPCSHAQPTWCDLCGDFIWGLYKQSLRCANCRFTCHHRCRALIQLDCSWDGGSLSDQSCVVEHAIETDTNVASVHSVFPNHHNSVRSSFSRSLPVAVPSSSQSSHWSLVKPAVSMSNPASSSDKSPSFENTWGSSASSGYCSEEEPESGFEQFFTARTSFFPKAKKPDLVVKKDEQTECGKQELTSAVIQQKVKEYNSQINSNLFMNVNKDGSYTGFIKVQFKLARPVSVPPPKKGGHDAGGRKSGGVKRRTSFYLPKDASKHLHISSRTSSREVIEALLKKFTVVDNPAKFALFERTERHEQVYVRKLSDNERPLRLRLSTGPNEKVLSFVLKENETGEVNWHAFSFPELKNFVRILQREEEEHVKQIVQRYALARTKMQETLAGSTPG